MMNKIAVAMIVASMSALPMASAAFAQNAATGANSQSGQKPVDTKTGMPTDCREGDTACNKTDSSMPATNSTGTTGTTETMGTTNGATSTQAPDASPKCTPGDKACDPNAPKN